MIKRVSITVLILSFFLILYDFNLVKAENISPSIITNEKDLYILIEKTLENGNEDLTFTVSNTFEGVILSNNKSNENALFDTLNNIMNLLLKQHPENNYIINKSWMISYNPYTNIVNFKFNYIYPHDKLLKIKEQVNTKANEIISQIIKPDMTDLEKVKAIHDYIVKNTKYDFENSLKNTVPIESYTSYGVLINRVGVCQGYTAAFNLLAKMSGIDSIGVSGTSTNALSSGPHSWNMIKVNGKIYYIDVTWDDPIPDQGDKVAYDYFNVTEQQIEKDHSWNKTKFSEKYLDYDKAETNIIPCSISNNTINNNNTSKNSNILVNSLQSVTDNITVIINGQNVIFDQKPILKNDITLVPMRAFFEALGAKVDWDQSTQTVTGTRDNKTLQLTIGSKIAKVNGKEKELAVEAQLINGHTYIPLRFVGESFGDEVIWKNGCIIINSRR
ncbi:stalk domain-containing protein [Aceticella autotrophica]|nr:stalk domain-containing protein [Aceticella autotrophica]